MENLKKWVLKNLENSTKKKLTTSKFFEKWKIFKILMGAHAVATKSDQKQRFYSILKFFVKIVFIVLCKKFPQQNIGEKCARIFPQYFPGKIFYAWISVQFWQKFSKYRRIFVFYSILLRPRTRILKFQKFSIFEKKLKLSTSFGSNFQGFSNHIFSDLPIFKMLQKCLWFILNLILSFLVYLCKEVADFTFLVYLVYWDQN